MDESYSANAKAKLGSNNQYFLKSGSCLVFPHAHKSAGMVKTPLWDVISMEEEVKKAVFQRMREIITTKKGSLPEEIAEFGLFLSGNSAKNITGASMSLMEDRGRYSEILYGENRLRFKFLNSFEFLNLMENV